MQHSKSTILCCRDWTLLFQPVCVYLSNPLRYPTCLSNRKVYWVHWSSRKRTKLQVGHRWQLSIHKTSNQKHQRGYLALVTLIGVYCFASPVFAYNADMESALVPIIQCRQLLDPVEGYLNNGNWDKARTSVNYCTRVLRLKTNMKTVTNLLSEDTLKDKAIEYTVDIDNAMSQLDASAYTPNFIPSDARGVTDQNQKYQMQAKDFYHKVIQELDAFLDLSPGEELKNAQDKASKLVPEVY
ncbi:uncharacterized protein Gasu_34880 [Galdieria sulphuraria]|uniref:Uncharacterized protein n=1 Tax=Galdieria sulphuraria TaxID=130081 RepID=M2XGC2_GALSU|nr:uncharacterized protein Gasu_34880 [Galdieria sulphuraria]EME29097.1 hypothetical protein Gasu_34880 [Galdieria sulphuraria]|eukprot:XP_005705617.1 hypothetical protein Gasu_34880 [Galdieria sulphuraria]